MAITNAQQARQLYKNGKRVGLFRGAQADASAGRGSMSPGTSGTGGQRGGNTGQGRDRDFQQRGMSKADYNKVTSREGAGAEQYFNRYDTFLKNQKANQERADAERKARDAKQKKAREEREAKERKLSQKGIEDAEKLLGGLTAKERYLSTLRGVDPEDIEGDLSSDLQTAITQAALGQSLPPQLQGPIELNERETALKEFLDRRNPVKTFGLSSLFTGPLQQFSDYSASINRPFFQDVITAGKIPGLNFDMTAQQYEDAYEKYMADRLAGKTDAYGNPIGGYRRENIGGQSVLVGGNNRDDSVDQKIIPIDDKKDDTEEEVNPRDYTGLAPRFMGSSFDFTGLADGGIARTGAMDGGRMRQMEMMEEEDDPTGGIMDLESGRQMYFLGKLVKKAGRAIKKVVKSPIGKAALLYFGGNALMGAGGGKSLGSFFGKGSFNPLKALITKGPQTGKIGSSGLGRILGKLGLAKEGSLTLGGNIGLGIGLPFALDALGVGKEEDEGMDLDEYYKTQGIDIDAIRNNPNRFLARRFMAEGGDAEPVAKKTMPLLDMDGMEKDYRADGGFVPIGRMERADDVPARLSKNEFVFTADAVRNAGDGDIDKGAEVMYNMMKNLESGGEVSEESQGLDGAKEMFQTSQRLEEVL